MDLPQAHAVEEKHVREFHDILQVLEHASGCDLGSYRVPSAELPRPNGGSGGAGDVHGHGENGNRHGTALRDRDSLMARIDGVLTFFGVKATLPRLNS